MLQEAWKSRLPAILGDKGVGFAVQASGTRVRLSHLIAWCASTVRLVDIPLDPLPGALMDNTRSRFGKFRPWMLAGAQSRLR